jgi:MFS family permease
MSASATSPTPARRVALAVVCAATLMAIVDETVVAVALPTIQRDLSFSTPALSWVVDAYLIGFGGLLLLAGRIGDLIGRRRVLLAGMALFSLASAACAVAPTAAALVGARFVQGVGGSLASAVALGMVTALFDDALARARGMAVYAFVGATGASLGLFVGGMATAAAGWRSAFLINVPIGIVALVAGRRALPHEAGPGLRAGVDAPSAALLVGGVMAAIAAIVEEPLLAAPAVVMLGVFARRQATGARPLLPRAAVGTRVVAGVNAAHALMVGGMFGFQFLMTLYLQRVLGFSAAEAGLGLLPIAVGIGTIALLGFPRVRRVRLAYPAALAVVAAGMALLVRVPVHGDYFADILPSAVLFAVGGGIALPAATTLAMSTATPQTAGALSGLINTSQQVGGALGLAVLAALAADRTAASGAPPADALVSGFHLAWAVGAVLVLAAAGVAAAAVRRPGSAERSARASSGGADVQPIIRSSPDSGARPGGRAPGVP